MSLYYDRDGKPMSLMAWAEAFESGGNIVKHTRLADVLVSTVWLGADHSFGGEGPPLIFETMIFDLDDDEHQWRYATELAALEHHGALAAAIKAGEPLPGPLEHSQKGDDLAT